MGAAAIAIAACCWLSFAAATSTTNGTIYFMGVAISEPLPTDYGTLSLAEVYPIGNVSGVQNLIGLSTAEVASLKNDFLSYLQNDLGISVKASVASLDAPTPVYVGPAPPGHNASVPFTASPPLNLLDQSGLPNAILSPFIRDPAKITSTSWAITGNSTLDSDTYNLVEAGFVLYPLVDLQLSSAVGTIPGFSFINVSILQWVGKVTQATFRITSSRKVPIPSGSSVVFNAAGYPGSQYVPLRTGEVQAAWSQGPSSTGEGYVLLWTTTYSFPGF